MKMLVLGCGNMASALVQGYYQKSKSIQFTCYTPSKTKAIELASKVNGQVLDHLNSIDHYDYYLIACKPQQFSDLAKNLVGKIPNKSVVISILAGISISTLQKELNAKSIVRVMPNTPTQIGLGINLCYFEQVQITDHQNIIDFLSGKFNAKEFNNEKVIDDITGIVASGPAYIFEWARIIHESLIENDVDSALARQLTKELFLGSSQLLFDSDLDFLKLRENVTSKGGVTFEALKYMHESKLEDIFKQAFNKAKQRTYELKTGK